jgi:GR25 family glycosyltransferase involved in LPS biosynthesis
MTLLDDAYAGYVNLARRTDRRKLMEATLQAVGIQATRHEGGQTPEQHGTHPDRVARMRKRTPGTIGCWFSQLSVLKRALELGKHALVMEDDLVFCSDLPQRLAIVEEFFEDHPWDVLWFGATFHANPSVWHAPDLDIGLTDNPRIVRAFGCWSTYCYLVNASSVEMILNRLDRALEDADGIDDAFIRFIEPHIYSYAFVPGMVKQYDDWGDVGGGFTKFSDFASLGPYWFQDHMTDFDPETFDWGET